VAVTVTDDRNESATVEAAVTISAPTAAFTWTAASTTATFDASTSTDAGSTITGYRWDFGDSSPAGTGPTVTHAYASAGTRTVTLTVSDVSGNSDTETQLVSVALPVSNPVAAFTSAVSNGVAAFDASASTTTNATITGYSWNFGDGTTGTGRTVSHPYAVGTWTVQLTITDSQGRTATVSHPVTVTTPVNQPPTAAFTATASALTATFSAVTSTDGDGSIASYAWTYGDGGVGSGVNPTHTYTAGGSYTVRLTVTDNLGAQGTTTKTVTVIKPSNDIDYLASTTATKSSTLVPASTAAVTQHFTRSVDTGEFYSSQTHGEPDGITESVRLSRMRVDGTLIDQMFLTYAGHGSMFELEYVNGVMYIWLTWQRNTLGGPAVNDIVRFPYKAGTFTRTQVTGLTVKIPGPTYRLVTFDHEAGYACVRTTTATSETFTRYPLAECHGGQPDRPGRVPVDVLDVPTDAAGLRDVLRQPVPVRGRPDRRPRLGDRQADPHRHSWTSGNTVRTVDMTGYLGTGRGEPESVAVYNTGINPVLFFGFSYGPSAARTPTRRGGSRSPTRPSPRRRRAGRVTPGSTRPGPPGSSRPAPTSATTRPSPGRRSARRSTPPGQGTSPPSRPGRSPSPTSVRRGAAPRTAPKPSPELRSTRASKVSTGQAPSRRSSPSPPV
jgi:PKD repeat protein